MTVIPQLDFSTYFSEIVWVILFIIGINIFFRIFVLPRFKGLINLREKELEKINAKINTIKTNIDKYQNDIDLLLEEYEKYKSHNYQNLEQTLLKYNHKYDKKIKEEFDEKYKVLEKDIEQKKLGFEKDFKKHFQKEMENLKHKLNLYEKGGQE